MYEPFAVVCKIMQEGFDFMKYDVIIIGAGPGGIFSAYELLQKKDNLSIAVFDSGYSLEKRRCPIDGEKVNLTPKEYDLLFYMIQNRNIALSRDKLLSDIWGYDFFGDDRTIDTHVKNLRNNLGKYRKFIVTLRGIGYKFEYEE